MLALRKVLFIIKIYKSIQNNLMYCRAIILDLFFTNK